MHQKCSQVVNRFSIAIYRYVLSQTLKAHDLICLCVLATRTEMCCLNALLVELCCARLRFSRVHIYYITRCGVGCICLLLGHA